MTSNSYKNKVIAITRPSDRSQEAIDIIESYGAKAFVAPTLELEIAPKKSLKKLYDLKDKWDWIVFTSPSSIEAISKYWPRFANEIKNHANGENNIHYSNSSINSSNATNDNCNNSNNNGNNCKIAAIGPKTKEIAISKGFDIEFVPDSYVAEGLLDSFRGYDLKDKLIALPRTLDARKILPNGLKDMGANVKVIEAYKSIFPLDTVRIELLIEMILADNDYKYEYDDVNICESCSEGFKFDSIDAITFTSPLTVKNFFKVVADNKKDDLVKALSEDVLTVAIGPITQNALNEFNVKSIAPENYTVKDMMDTLFYNL